MINSSRNIFAVVLVISSIGFGACGSAPTNTVSTGNTGGSGNTVAADKPSNANVENVGVKPVAPSNTAIETKPSNKAIDSKSPPKIDETGKSNAPTGGKIGVPECDEYLAKYEACINAKVPEAERAALMSPLEMMRKGWQKAVTNQQAKAALPGGCKIALTTAKESMSRFSCDW